MSFSDGGVSFSLSTFYFEFIVSLKNSPCIQKEKKNVLKGKKQMAALFHELKTIYERVQTWVQTFLFNVKILGHFFLKEEKYKTLL